MPSYFLFRYFNKEQLELYLEVTAEMNDKERKAIGAQISNSQTLYTRLKRFLFPPSSEVIELESHQRNNHFRMATESCSVTDVDQQNTTVDESPENLKGNILDNDDHEDDDNDNVSNERMSIQEIVDEGIDHVVQALISQSQETVKSGGTTESHESV